MTAPDQANTTSGAAVAAPVERPVRRRGGFEPGYVARTWAQQKARERERDERFPGWKYGPTLSIGDEAETDYEGGTRRVRIVARAEASHCQSGVLFKVAPALRNNGPEAEFDAHWFRPVTPNAEVTGRSRLAG